MVLARFFRSSPLGGVCAVLLLLLASVAVMAERLAPHNPLTANYAVTRDPPFGRHVLGTDHLGRDVLMSLPALILALLLMAALGAGLSTVIIAIAVTRVPLSTRVVRSMVLSVKELAYVEAAGALGASGARVMARHVAPQCVAPFLIITTGHLGAAIFIEAALSFVGVGVPPPTPSWGNMLGGVLAEAFKPPWWMVVFPGTAITVTILAVNLFGDALRDFLDPKLK